jgi:hypothetical protein
VRAPQRQSGQASSAGILTLTFAVAGSRPLTVTQVSVEMATGGDLAACTLRLNGALVSPAVATGDAVGGDPPIIVMPGDQLTVTWTGATAGSIGTALFLYDDAAG